MHDNSDNQFDSFVRSMMEKAQEQAPAGVWEAIESRLPQQEKVPGGWWRWAGLGLAAVAAALGTLFIVNRNTKDAPSQVVAPVVAEAVSDSSAPAIAPVKALTQEEGTAFLAQARTAPVSTAPVSTAPVAQEVTDNQAGAAGTREEQVVVAETSPAPQAETATEQIEEGADDAPVEYRFNPFAGPEEHATGKRGRAQLQVNGLVGGNEASQSLFPQSVYMGAPSVSPDGTAISENSESIYGIPLSFGLGMRIYLSDRLSLGTGLNFSLLTRSFNGIVTDLGSGEFGAGDVNHTIQYVGIPVNIYYDLLDSDFIKVYSFVGGAAEKALSNKYIVQSGDKEATYSQKVDGMQWSADLGLGVQFNLSNNIGLYVDPSARYYFDCNQPKSIRTRKPFMFGFEAGLRFNL